MLIWIYGIRWWKCSNWVNWILATLWSNYWVIRVPWLADSILLLLFFNATEDHVKPYNNILYHAMLCNNILEHAILCNVMNTMQYPAVHAIPYYYMQYTLPCNTTQCYTIPHNTMTGLLYFASCVFPGRRRSPQKLAPLSSPDTKLAPLVILLRTSLKKKNRDTLLKGMYSGSLDPSASLSKPQCNAELHTSLGLCWTMTELISATQSEDLNKLFCIFWTNFSKYYQLLGSWSAHWSVNASITSIR